MRIDVITLFPEMFQGLTTLGVVGRAHSDQKWQLHCWNPRQYTHDVHHTVDDRPYGGGPGMVMMAEPLKQACLAIAQATPQLQRPRIALSPCGKLFTQEDAATLAQTGAILICGRYEGIDQRFINHYVDAEYSIGDFVLSGGEIAAMAMIDAMVRLLPSVLHTADSVAQDSFHPDNDYLLDCPHYTRPEIFESQAVPAVLKSGNHQQIAHYRRQQSLALTATRRPDLLRKAHLQAVDWDFLQSLQNSD